MIKKIAIEILKFYVSISIPAAAWMLALWLLALLFNVSYASDLTAYLPGILSTGPQMFVQTLATSWLVWFFVAWFGWAIYFQLRSDKENPTQNKFLAIAANPWTCALVGLVVWGGGTYAAQHVATSPIFGAWGGWSGIAFFGGLTIYLQMSKLFRHLEPAWMRTYRRWPRR